MEQLRQEKLEIDQQLRAIQGSNMGSMQNFPMSRRSDRGYSNDDAGNRSTRGSRGRGRGGSGSNVGGGRGSGGSRYGNNYRKFNNESSHDDPAIGEFTEITGSFYNRNYRKHQNGTGAKKPQNGSFRENRDSKEIPKNTRKFFNNT